MNNSNDRATVFFFLVIGLFIYQSIVLVTALILYFIVRLVRIDWKIVIGVGGISLVITVLLFFYHYNNLTLHQVILNGLIINFYFWKTGLEYGFHTALSFVWSIGKFYLLGFPFFFLGLMALVQLIPLSAHEKALKNVARARHGKKNDIKASVTQKKLNKLSDDVNGTLLGVSTLSGNAIVVPDYYINQMMLVLGTTGGGKTITLRRFYKRAIQAGYPLIIVDGKPTEESVAWIKAQAKAANKPFFGFNCDDNRHYDPLAQGGHSELKDKIMTLKDNWENDFYKTVAEDYLQTTFEVLLSQNPSYDLTHVANSLDYDELVAMVRQSGSDELKKRVKNLGHYDRKDIIGLQAHLNVLLNSEMGHYFKLNESTFSINDVIESSGVVYFALPALRYPAFAKVLGKFIVNDIKTVIDRRNKKLPIFISFDEFSVFAGEQALNVANMGRDKGVHALFGTQGIPDLKVVSPDFADQILNCVNSIICHRVNDQTSAETVSMWGGTKSTFTHTAQVDLASGGAKLGSVRETKEFVVHPDAIKQQLSTGEAFFITKVDGFRVEKVKIKYIN